VHSILEFPNLSKYLSHADEDTRMVPIQSGIKLHPIESIFPPKRHAMLHATTQPLYYNKSKSSSFSLYLKMFLLIFDPSTHVTKSSIPLVTRNAVSVIGSVPTLTCPCSISFVAAWTVSAIRRRVITTGRRRRQKAETVTERSTSESLAVLAVEGRIPMSWSLERRSFSCFRRKELSGGRAARRWASCLRLWEDC
jgi:hypothetical protein